MADNNNNTGIIDPSALKAIKAVDSQYKADAYSTTLDYNIEQSKMQHEKEMKEMDFDHNKKAAGWLWWMGWKMSSVSAATTSTLIVAILIGVTTFVLSYFNLGNHIESFWKYCFHLFDILLGFFIGNRVSISSQKTEGK